MRELLIFNSEAITVHLGKEHHKAAVVRELQVLGVELMERRDVALDEILLLVV